MFASFLSRWPFVAAVALVAAVASDLLVEAVANAGAFGPAYFDSDDSSIVPSLIAALLLAVFVIGLHVRALCGSSRATRRNWLAKAAGAVARRPPLRDFPAVAGIQFGALFAMESIEQFARTGHLAGDMSWLGGPVVAGTCTHLALGAACTLLAAWLMRLCVARFAPLVCGALDRVLCARGPRPTAVFVARRDAGSCNHCQAAWVRRISGRAPPLFSPPASLQ